MYESKTITVRRSVLMAAQELQKEAASTNGKPHHLAQKKLDDSAAAEDRTVARFWRDVWIHLMVMEYDPGEITIIVEDISPKGDNGDPESK